MQQPANQNWQWDWPKIALLAGSATTTLWLLTSWKVVLVAAGALAVPWVTFATLRAVMLWLVK